MVIRVSRHGMTRCTSCDRHIRLEAVVSETRCPFCGGALTTPSPAKSSVLGRTGGALAASLLSFGIGAGCLDDEGRPADTSDTVDAAETSISDTALTDTDTTDTNLEPDSIQPLYGLPMDVTLETADDTTPQPEYGLPMDTSESDAKPSEDIPIAPLYGLPPSDTIEPADDATPQPEYGLPMDVIDDTGPSDTKDEDGEDGTGSDGNIPVPLYGLPPG